MAALASKYSRQSFETASDVEALSQQLADELALRMRGAESAAAEVAALVNELRSLGHQLYSWDSNGGEWEIWGGDYANPEKTRIMVSFHYGEDASPWADVAFGPWPDREPMPACQQCGEAMTSTTLRLQAVGHGQVDAPPIDLELWLEESEPLVARCGVRSIGVQVPALRCSNCHALWIRDVRAVQWTG